MVCELFLFRFEVEGGRENKEKGKGGLQCRALVLSAQGLRGCRLRYFLCVFQYVGQIWRFGISKCVL